MTTINITNPETKRIIEFTVQGVYAPKRLQFLAEKAPEYIYELFKTGRLQEFAEQFEENITAKIMDLFVQIRDRNDDYRKAQAVGDIELAEKLANNDMETAKQVAIREWVYAL
ncbi:MAG: hypothetical protein FWF76_02775 [Oscillospiraceae bacterium]|nr:hypothetical protein [Oscillospiraceae bacterium]